MASLDDATVQCERQSLPAWTALQDTVRAAESDHVRDKPRPASVDATDSQQPGVSQHWPRSRFEPPITVGSVRRTLLILGLW